MNSVPFLYLACLLAGFALVNLPAISFLVGLTGFFNIVGVVAIIVFSFALLYLGLKALINK
ncbi:MAG: hypothetical protein Q8906_03480 [Bacillota bacterium]|nr:hypothetical protein [Bacillota bacterium]